MFFASKDSDIMEVPKEIVTLHIAYFPLRLFTMYINIPLLIIFYLIIRHNELPIGAASLRNGFNESTKSYNFINDELIFI